VLCSPIQSRPLAKGGFHKSYAQKLRGSGWRFEQFLRDEMGLSADLKGILIWHVICVGEVEARGVARCGSVHCNKPKPQQENRNMRLNQCLMMAGMAAVLSLGASQLVAQENNNPPAGCQDRQGRRGGPRGHGGNFDPAQTQQRMMERYKEQLEVKDDTEWKAIEPLVQKVMDARMASFSGMGRGMFGRGGRGGADSGTSSDRGSRGGGGFFGQNPSPEAEALQKAIDGKAPNSELKAALAKYVESRKAKQADLEKAQADLRKVLSVRQEAIAALSGLL